MRLRIARKVYIGMHGWLCGNVELPAVDYRMPTEGRAYRRILRVQRRHFPDSVLRPLSHRKREP